MGLKFIAFVLVFLGLIPHIIWLMLWPVCRLFRYRLPYLPFGITALSIIVISAVLLLYGMYVGRWRVVTNTVEFNDDNIPEAFDGYRIVHISDLHLYTFAEHREKLQGIVDRINALNPDLVCFTGDMVSISNNELKTCGDILKGIKARDGVKSVLGNHDFFIYSIRDEARRKAAVDSLCLFQSDELGWEMLRNRNVRIERDSSHITIVGIDNSHGAGQGFHTIDSGDLGAAMSGTDGFKILLSHDPSFWESEVVGKEDIALTLSGHTHAAQIKLFGWTPASWMFRQSVGRYDIGQQSIYVNAGLGCTAQLRIGADAEITLIELKK